MYKEFLVTLHKGYRTEGSPRIFEEGECSIAQDCYFDEIGNVYSRKFIHKIKEFTSPIKTIFPYNHIGNLIISLLNGSLYTQEGTLIGISLGKEKFSCVEYGNVLYLVNSISSKRYNGEKLQDIGNIQPATPTVAIGAAGLLTGDYYYKITYVDENGKESHASLVSGLVTLATQKATISVVASSVTKVRYINLYRLGGTLTDWYYVNQYSNTDQNISDNTADASLDTLFDADNNDPPPDGLNYLIEHYERILGAKTNDYPNSIDYTVEYEPEYWGENSNQQYLISNRDKCNGILSWGVYVIYFKMNTVFVFEGSNPGSWHKRKSSSSVGNLAPWALQFFTVPTSMLGSTSIPVFLSYLGLYGFDGNKEIYISPKIKGFFKTNKQYLKNAVSCIYDNKYYLSFPDTDITLIYDFEQKIFYTYNLNFTELCYNYLDGNVYAGDSNYNLVLLEQDTNKDNYDIVHFHIKSKAYALHEVPNNTGYLRDYIITIHTKSQNVTFNIYIDGVLGQTKSLNTSYLQRVRGRFNANLKGRYAEFEFIYTGTSQIEIETPIVINPKENE